MTRQINLCVGINTTGYLGGAWKYRTGDRHDVYEGAYYTRLTQIAHRGKLDAVFFSDNPAMAIEPKGRPFHTFDPLMMATALMAQVPDIGVVVTASSTYNQPYNFARRTQTADILSGGRLMLNIVSSFNPYVAVNFGNEPLPPRPERYARATEFLDVCKELWNSWDMRKDGEVPPELFWSAASARPINHQGAYYHVRGPLNVPRGPQGHPVIAQAGGSEGGIDLAAKHGEVIYCNMLSVDAGLAFGSKVRERAAALGRDPRSVLIMPGVVPIIADSREEALRLHELYSGTGSEDGLLKRFVAEHGLDAATFDPDAVLDPARFVPDPTRGGSVGMGLALSELLTYEKLTARQAVRRTEGFHRLLLGTPEDIADGIMDFWEAGAVDAWVIQPPRAPDDIELFVDKVVPILQDRGVFRREYAGDTLRQRYGLPEPA